MGEIRLKASREMNKNFIVECHIKSHRFFYGSTFNLLNGINTQLVWVVVKVREGNWSEEKKKIGVKIWKSRSKRWIWKLPVPGLLLDPLEEFEGVDSCRDKSASHTWPKVKSLSTQFTFISFIRAGNGNVYTFLKLIEKG